MLLADLIWLLAPKRARLGLFPTASSELSLTNQTLGRNGPTSLRMLHMLPLTLYLWFYWLGFGLDRFHSVTLEFGLQEAFPVIQLQFKLRHVNLVYRPHVNLHHTLFRVPKNDLGAAGRAKVVLEEPPVEFV